MVRKRFTPSFYHAPRRSPAPGMTWTAQTGIVSATPSVPLSQGPMPRSARLITLLTALVAILVTGLMPAAGSWSCPDGTACVYTAGRGFHCQGDKCRMACCVGKKPANGCGHCDHGSVPTGQVRRRSLRASLSGTEQCRYQEPVTAEKAIARPSPSLELDGHAVAVLPAPTAPLLAAGCWVRTAPIRGSPSLLSPLSPSSPRAPPGPLCA